MKRMEPPLGGDAGALRLANKRRVYNLIFKYRTVSRCDLARMTSLRPPTISSIVRQLQQEGMIVGCGKGATSRGGGPAPEMYRINNVNKYFVGVNINHNSLTGVVLSPDQECVTARSQAMSGEIWTEASALMDALDGIVRECLQEVHARGGVAAGMGISCAALADNMQGRVTLSNIPSLNGTSVFCLKEYFERTYRLPVYVDNDINMLLIAMQTSAEALVDADPILCLGIYEYAGMSIMTGGKLYRGVHNLAGNMLLMDGMWAMKDVLARAEKLLAAHPESGCALAGRKPTAEDLCEAALRGEPWATELLDTFAERVGRTVATLQQIIDAECVVIYCPLFSENVQVFDRIVAACNDVIFAPYRATRYVKKKLDDRVLATSAALSACSVVFQVPI